MDMKGVMREEENHSGFILEGDNNVGSRYSIWGQTRDDMSHMGYTQGLI